MKELSLIRLLLRYQDQAGIIYTGTRRSANDVAAWLDHFHIFHEKVAAYHGGLDSSSRADIQDAFLHNQKQIIVATNAFGMGVDKPDVRFVIHYYPPPSLENYYQEVGRGGRDGAWAEGYLLYYPPDEKVVSELVTSGEITSQRLPIVTHKLNSVFNFINFHECRSQFILKYFGEVGTPCGECDRCSAENPRDTLETHIFQKLLQVRNDIGKNLHCEPAYVTSVSNLKWLAVLQPSSAEQCLEIPGVGHGWLKNVWPYFRPIMESLPDIHPIAPSGPVSPGFRPNPTLLGD